jgi:putative glutamine amidotransferase
MANPLIGITTYNDKNKGGYPTAAVMHKYIDAITQAGGTPVLIPSGLDEENRKVLIQRLDGILFTGGGDIALEYFQGKPHPSVGNIDKKRDELELAMVKSAVQADKPFLGICRGFQVINVALGGNLYTDIIDQKAGALKHDHDSNTEREYLAHPVKVEAGTRLAQITGMMDLMVNSLHHQGAMDIPADLKAAAYAPDGLVEALELPEHAFGLAVQWHPEWLTNQEPTRRLFRAFVEAASKAD